MTEVTDLRRTNNMKFIQFAANRSYVAADGAMGTYFSQLNSGFSFESEKANIFAPHVIRKIHEEYIEAGASIIRTNTFAANTISLNEDIETVRKIISSGYEIACNAAKDRDVFVFADIGPIHETEDRTISDEYYIIADTFLDCGANNFIFETFPDSQAIIALAGYIKGKNPDAYIIGEVAINPDGWTRKSLSGETLIKELCSSEFVDACGYNCISGPAHLLDRVRRTNICSDKLMSIMPNAGYPSTVNERTVFVTDPSYFARVMKDIHEAGIRILGGCCGTTPEHIKAMIKDLNNDTDTYIVPIKRSSIRSKPVPVDNVFRNKLDAGKKVIAVELDPPSGSDTVSMLRGAKELKSYGADIITIADCPLSKARADSSILAAKITREAGIQTIPHLTCRDRNLNAIKALLLGLHSENIRNILAVTGDPIPEDLRSEIKGVFSLNSFMLIRFIKELNKSDFEGDPMYVGAALNVNAPNFIPELKRAVKKVESGADFFLTQPIFTKKALDNLINAASTLGKPVLGGIMPIVSHRNAVFLKNEIPGMDIPDEICDSFKDLDRGKAEVEGIRIASSTAEKIIGICSGIYLVTPFNRWKMTGEITLKILKAQKGISS